MLKDIFNSKLLITIADHGGVEYLPSNSLEGLDVAMRMGARYVSPDVCLDKFMTPVVMYRCIIDPLTSNIMELDFWENEEYCPTIDGVKTCMISSFSQEDLSKVKLRGKLDLYDDLFELPLLSDYVQKVYEFNAQLDSEDKSKHEVGVMLNLNYPEDLALSYDEEELTNRVLDVLREFDFDVHEPKPDFPPKILWEVCQFVIVSESLEVLQYITRSTTIPAIYQFDHIYTDQLNYLGADIWEDLSEIVDEYKISGVSPSAVDFLIGKQLAYERLVVVRNLGLGFMPHLRVPFNDLLYKPFIVEDEYFMYCCLHVDGLITGFPDRLVRTNCDRIPDQLLSNLCHA